MDVQTTKTLTTPGFYAYFEQNVSQTRVLFMLFMLFFLMFFESVLKTRVFVNVVNVVNLFGLYQEQVIDPQPVEGTKTLTTPGFYVFLNKM